MLLFVPPGVFARLFAVCLMPAACHGAPAKKAEAQRLMLLYARRRSFFRAASRCRQTLPRHDAAFAASIRSLPAAAFA